MNPYSYIETYHSSRELEMALDNHNKELIEQARQMPYFDIESYSINLENKKSLALETFAHRSRQKLMNKRNQHRSKRIIAVLNDTMQKLNT